MFRQRYDIKQSVGHADVLLHTLGLMSMLKQHVIDEARAVVCSGGVQSSMHCGAGQQTAADCSRLVGWLVDLCATYGKLWC